MDGFKPISWQFKNRKAVRQFFGKQHKLHKNTLSDEIPIDGKSLLLLNIPPTLTAGSIKSVFSNYFGQVIGVYLQDAPGNESYRKFHSKRLETAGSLPPASTTNLFKTHTEPIDRLPTYSCAYIVFADEKSTEKSLNYDKILKFDYTPPPKRQTTIKISNEIDNDCDSYLDWFDKISTEADGEFQEVAEDDDWQVVGDKQGGLRFTEANQKRSKNLLHSKRKAMTVSNFYAHQKREHKKTKLSLIRDAYEESKNKIAAARKQRTFKPF